MHSCEVVALILNYNKQDDTLRCVSSVCALESKPKIVVVDNGSTDNPSETLISKFPEITLVQNSSNLGPPMGRNVGFQYINKNFQYEFLLCLDNDTILDPLLLKKLLDALDADKGAAMACPKAYRALRSKEIMSVGLHVNLHTGNIHDIGSGELDTGQYARPGYVDACGAFCFLIRKEALLNLKGFDEYFAPYGWADVDLCLRANKLGYKIRYVPEAIIYHTGTVLGRGFIPNRERLKVRNFFRLMERHATALQKLTCLVIMPLRVAPRVIGLMFCGQLRVLSFQFGGFLDSLRRS